MKYKNPVIEGFYPDPSVCRVKDDYYLVTSSFEYFPGVPIFHSKDLVNWNQIGYCLTTDEQLDIYNAKNSYGIYAPTIRYSNGIFYMITTNVTNGTNFYVTSESPEGPWSSPIIVNGWQGIDPSLFFDDNGKVYIMGNSYKNKYEELGCYMAEIDIETGNLKSERKLVCKGSGGKAPEAPHLYKKDGLYYLILAEGGTEYGHMVTVFRSNNPCGPFEGYKGNPILSHRSRKSEIQAVGHMDMIEDHKGNWWGVCLGIRPKGSHAYFHHLGRETFLVPIKWNEDKWLTVGDNGLLHEEMECSLMEKCQDRPKNFIEKFSEKQLDMQWNYLRNPIRENYSLEKRKNWICLKGNKENLTSGGRVTFIGKRQCHFKGYVNVSMEFLPKNDGEEAGVTVYMSDEYHYDLAIIRRDSKKYLLLRKKIGSIECEEISFIYNYSNIKLGINASDKEYEFFCELPDGERKSVGKGECKFLASEFSGTFTGVYYGIYATGNGKDSTTDAYFKDFKYIVN